MMLEYRKKSSVLASSITHEINETSNVVFSVFCYQNIFGSVKAQSVSKDDFDNGHNEFYGNAKKIFKENALGDFENKPTLCHIGKANFDNSLTIILMCLNIEQDQSTPPACVIIFMKDQPTKAVNNHFEKLCADYSHRWSELSASRPKFAKRIYSKMAKTGTRYSIYGLLALLFLLVLCIPVQTTEHFSAEIWPQTTTVSVELPGVIEEIKVKQGEYVHKGQLLLKLDSRDLESQLRTAEANYAAATNAVNRIIMIEPQKLYTEPQLLAKIVKSQNRENAIKRLLQRQNIHAPQSGNISFDSNLISIGHTVDIGQVIMEIHNHKQQEINFYIPMNSNIEANIGQTVSYEPSNSVFGSYPAVIDSVEARAKYRNTPTERYITAIANFINQHDEPIESKHGQIIIETGRKSLIAIILNAPLNAINRFRNSEA